MLKTLIFVVAALLVIGVINLYSALNVWGEHGNIHLWWMQIVWIGIGILFLVPLALSDYRVFERLAYPLYIVSILFLIASLFTGHVVAGHKSWLGFGGIGIQPSEFAKVVLILVLARYFANNPQPDGFNLVELIKPILVTLLPCMLVALQGDTGTALFFVLLGVSFAWFGKIKMKLIVIVALMGILAAIFGYYRILSDYQRARITTFLNPTSDVKGSGYQTIQSRIAVGSGQIWGKGYLKGNINKLKYLPEKHTDFIFPVLAEEWGFAGSLVMLALYYALLSMIIEIAKHARDRFGTFITFGIGAYLFWQIIINLGGVLGLMPLTGVTLPFLSYGGSSTISTLASIGLLLAVSRKRFLF